MPKDTEDRVYDDRFYQVYPEASKTVRVPAKTYPLSAGFYGGLAGGVCMIPFAVFYGLLSGHGMWYPVNLIAATLFRSWQHASPAELGQFSLPGLIFGLMIHLLMSAGLGFTFALMLPGLSWSPVFWAFLWGSILWGGAVFAGLPLINPVMARLVDWPSFALANITYSLVLGLWVARTPKVPAE